MSRNLVSSWSESKTEKNDFYWSIDFIFIAKVLSRFSSPIHLTFEKGLKYLLKNCFTRRLGDCTVSLWFLYLHHKKYLSTLYGFHLTLHQYQSHDQSIRNDATQDLLNYDNWWYPISIDALCFKPLIKVKIWLTIRHFTSPLILSRLGPF